MRFDNQLMAPVALALLTALVVSFLMTPVVKSFAYKVGAIDVPKDERRMHHKPIPRLGGLAIFAGFMASILLFVDIRLNPQMQSILLGAVIIVVLGVVDDIMALPAKLKFVVQIVAALIPALNGVSIQALSNPNIFSANAYWVLNWLSVPITVLWIVGITNAVNLIDGLDGLANGVSAISAATVLVIALICSEAQVAVVMAALVGACVGFLPYNLNPAKMFMGDTGATFLGFILSTMSIQGLFKFYAVISFAVPFLILGLPIFDTAFAMIRRMAHGQSPMHADRGHIHHRLIDMGLNQKQAVATLYVISGILGLSAVVLTTGGEAKAMLLLIALCVVAVVAARVVFPKEVKEELHEELEELTEFVKELGEKPFRAKQLYQWMHVKLAESLDECTNLPKSLKEKLSEYSTYTSLKTVKMLESGIDGTRKYLFGLDDGNVIESVLMKYHHGNSVCISSQVGCRMGCRFCASTLDGLTRNLRPSEMLDQIYRIQRSTGERVSNVVVMGSGEPMDNYDNLIRFIRLLSDENGLNISQRNITVSTCGIVPKILKLAEEGLSITLALSLHAPDDETRKTLMPIANSYSLSEVLPACKEYYKKTGRRLTFEYSLVQGVNDNLDEAKRLTALLKDMQGHVNLIPVNPIKERDFVQSDTGHIQAFKNKLESKKIHVTIRREMGRDIDGACGQLRRRHTQEMQNPDGLSQEEN